MNSLSAPEMTVAIEKFLPKCFKTFGSKLENEQSSIAKTSDAALFIESKANCNPLEI